MGLKDIMQEDIDNIYFSEDEFGENHIVDGTEITCVIDKETLKNASGGEEFAVSESGIILFAKTKDMPPKKPYGSSIVIDGVDYIVEAWEDEAGVCEVTLSINVMS